MAAWERQQAAGAMAGEGEGKGHALEIEVLDDVTQMALAIITAAAFGFPIHAAYGKERSRHRRAEEEGVMPLPPSSSSSSSPPTGGGKKKKKKVYHLSFTRCMEVVSQRTLAKVLLPAWALRLPVLGLSEVGLAFRVCAYMSNNCCVGAWLASDRWGMMVTNPIPLIPARFPPSLVPSTLMFTKEFNEHLLDVVDRERALQQEERRGSAGGNGEKEGGEKGQTLFRLLVQANETEGESEGSDGGGGGAAVVARGRRLEMAELLGNAFIFLLAGAWVDDV